MCDADGSFSLHGDGFSRRRFLKVAGTGLVASYFADVLEPRLLLADTTSADVHLRNSAKSCIFIFLSGAPSQTDLWDLKEGSWTPSDFAPTSHGDVRWPQGLLGKTSDHLSRLSIIRCSMAWAAVHSLGQAWAQIARNPGGATGSIAPHIGAVVSLESQATRKPSEVLPGFIALNAGSIPTSGYLPAKYAPFGVTTASTGLAALQHPDGATRFASRWDFLHRLDAARSSDILAKRASDMDDFYDASKQLMDTPSVNALFSFTDTEHTRYGASDFGDSLVVARNLVSSGMGARFVQATLGGWDHHSDIYDATANSSLYSQCAQFDPAFAALLADLSSTPGLTAGKTMLDDTLIVVVGEFGRTVGALNNQGGRDHYLRNSVVLAGGGTRGGQVIGKTDSVGDKVTDYQWSGNRDVRPEDVTCTMYSALGIDYTTMRTDDPLGRGFEYVPGAQIGEYVPVDELF
jgi:hypothetical protein